MKLYAIYTPSHVDLYNNWFMPTLEGDIQLNIQFIHIDGSGYYKTSEWSRVILKKAEVIIEAIKANLGRKFIFSDVDIQFFSPFSQILDTLSENYDIICQAESPFLNYCTGFFVCLGSNETLRFWEEIYLLIKNKSSWHDQDAFNFFANRPKFKDLRLGTLPLQFMGGGTFTGRPWQIGDELPIPKGIIMHHANFTKGVSNKIAQLNYVRRKVESYKYL